MREIDQQLHDWFVDDHDYESRSPYYHTYEDVKVDTSPRDHFGRSRNNYLQGNSQDTASSFKRGDRVQVGGPLGGYGTVECTFLTDSNVKVRMDQTFRFVVFHESDVQVIQKIKERGEVIDP